MKEKIQDFLFWLACKIGYIFAGLSISTFFFLMWISEIIEEHQSDEDDFVRGYD